MATGSSSNSGIEDNQAYTHRCLNLITNVGGMVYKHILKNELKYRNMSLRVFLERNITEIRNTIPYKDMANVLFPGGGSRATETDERFDITLTAYLLQSFFIKDGELLLVGNYSTGNFPKKKTFNSITPKEAQAWNWSGKNTIFPWNTNVVADISRIKGYRNMIHDIWDTRKWLTENKFKILWNDISAALLNLGRAFGIPNMFFEIEKVLHEYLDPNKHDEVMKRLDSMKYQLTETQEIVVAKGRDNLQECSEREMALRQNSFSDEVFVKTNAYDKISRRLQEKGIVVISGNHGEGKSTIALKLISEHYSKGYRILKTPKDWRSVCIETCDVILIDDMFGIAVLDESDLKKWQRYLGEIRQAVLNDDVFVIITIKPHILQQVKKRILKLWNWFDENVESVISETMSNDERRDILESHLNANRREINNVSFNDCLTKYTNRQSAMFNIGFPQCASMYAKFPEFFENSGFTFFEKPIYFIKTCLCEMFNEDTSIFSAFSFLWSQPNQTVMITELEKAERDEHSEISRRLKLCKVPSSSLVRDTLLLYKDGFINYIEDNEEFRFSHDIIADVVGLLVFENDKKTGIDLCPLDFLLMYVTTADITQDKDRQKVCIKKPRFEQLCSRLISLNRSKNKVIWHDAFRNDEFLKELAKKEKEILEIFHTACYDGDHKLVDRLLKFRFAYKEHVENGFSPIHSAAYYGHTKTVEALAKNDPDQLKLKITGLDRTLSKYEGASLLHIAVLKDFSALIKALLSLDADVKLTDCEGNTPFLLSIKESKYKITRLLLGKTGVGINTPDNKHSTPLMEAIIKNNIDLVKTICKKVTSLNSKNLENKTALDIAVANKNESIKSLLKDKGAKIAAEL